MIKPAWILVATFIALAACWPGWRLDEGIAGQKVDPIEFAEAARAFAARYQVGAVVEPPPGPVPMLVRRFEFWPALHLRPGQTYRLRLLAEDGIHSVVHDGREVLLIPGEVQELVLTPKPGEELELRCNEYCGLGHNRMRAKLN